LGKIRQILEISANAICFLFVVWIYLFSVM
jgi:hypothetical protein